MKVLRTSNLWLVHDYCPLSWNPNLPLCLHMPSSSFIMPPPKQRAWLEVPAKPEMKMKAKKEEEEDDRGSSTKLVTIHFSKKNRNFWKCTLCWSRSSLFFCVRRWECKTVTSLLPIAPLVAKNRCQLHSIKSLFFAPPIHHCTGINTANTHPWGQPFSWGHSS